MIYAPNSNHRFRILNMSVAVQNNKLKNNGYYPTRITGITMDIDTAYLSFTSDGPEVSLKGQRKKTFKNE